MGPLFAASMFVGMHKIDTAIFGERSDALSKFGNALDRSTEHFVMGATNTLTMGATSWLRKTISLDLMGQDWDGIHEDAFAYKAGQVAGAVVNIVIDAALTFFSGGSYGFVARGDDVAMP